MVHITFGQDFLLVGLIYSTPLYTSMEEMALFIEAPRDGWARLRYRARDAGVFGLRATNCGKNSNQQSRTAQHNKKTRSSTLIKLS